MKLRKLGDKKVPAVGLGCMGMSEFYGETDDKVSIGTLHESYAMGYRHYDTADMYGEGHNENLIGEFLKQLNADREEIFICTKGGIVRDSTDKYNISVNGSREYIRRACESSLKRLNVEYIDLYYLHRIDPAIEIEESIGAMKELVEEGKIRSIGLCEVSAEQLEIANSVHPVAAVQSELSLWSRDAEDTVIPKCVELDIAFVAFSPLGRGFLSGKIDRNFMKNASEHLDFRKKMPRFSEENIDINSSLVSKLESIAAELEVTPSLLALYWALSRSPNIHIIPGTKTTRYLANNFNAQHCDIGSEVITRLDSIFNLDAVSGSRYPQKILQKSTPTQ